MNTMQRLRLKVACTVVLCFMGGQPWALGSMDAATAASATLQHSTEKGIGGMVSLAAGNCTAVVLQIPQALQAMVAITALDADCSAEHLRVEAFEGSSVRSEGCQHAEGPGFATWPSALEQKSAHMNGSIYRRLYLHSRCNKSSSISIQVSELPVEIGMPDAHLHQARRMLGESTIQGEPTIQADPDPGRTGGGGQSGDVYCCCKTRSGRIVPTRGPTNPDQPSQSCCCGTYLDCCSSRGLLDQICSSHNCALILGMGLLALIVLIPCLMGAVWTCWRRSRVPYYPRGRAADPVQPRPNPQAVQQLRAVVRAPAPEDVASVRECAVCMEDIAITKDTWVVFPCRHGTCTQCFEGMVKHHQRVTACPLCRDVLYEDPQPLTADASVGSHLPLAMPAAQAEGSSGAANAADVEAPPTARPRRNSTGSALAGATEAAGDEASASPAARAQQPAAPAATPSGRRSSRHGRRGRRASSEALRHPLLPRVPQN